jgi:signal transduction histidine kinase
VENGEPAGFSIDYLKLLEQRMDVRFEFVTWPTWEQINAAFERGELDVLHSLPGAEAGALQTEPYLYFQPVYVVQKGDPDVNSPDDLAGKTVSVIEGVPFVEQWRRKYPGIRFLVTDTEEENIAAVASGRSDVSIIMKQTYRYFERKNALTNLRVGGLVKDDDGMENCFRIIVRSEHLELRAAFQRAMDSVTQAEMDALWDKWFHEDEFNYALLWKVVAGACAVFLLVLIRYRMVSAYNKKLRVLNQEQAKTIEERDRIISVISHDLRQPVQGLNTFLELLEKGTVQTDTEAGRRMIRQTRDRGERVYESMENLLAWLNAHHGSIHPRIEQLPLYELVEDSRELLQSSIQSKSIQIENCVEDELEVSADERMLCAVLRNLLANAIKFSDSGGSVRIFAEQDAGAVRIRVEDDGAGMDAETVQRILAGTAHSQPGTDGERGSGLGLKLVREFLGLLGSELHIESSPGTGSVFSFCLDAVG